MKQVCCSIFSFTFVSLLTLALLCFGSRSSAQQRVQFTQYMYDGLLLNPAYAGVNEALNLTFINRSQWQGLDGAPSTQVLVGHTLFRNEHLGLGFFALNDKIGVHKNLLASISSAYHVKTSENSYVSIGLQMGVDHKRSDYTSLPTAAVNDPSLFNSDLSNTIVDFGFGVYYRSPNLDVGISVPEMRPQKFAITDSTEITGRSRQYFFFTRYRFVVNPHVTLEPSILFKYMENIPLSYDLNFNVLLKKVLTVGVSYRKKESIDFLLTANITPQLRVGYAYDHTLGKIRAISSHSHELMVGYLFKLSQNQTASPR